MAKKDSCPRCGHQAGKDENHLTLVPFQLIKVPAGASAAPTATPQIPLRPVRLVIDPAIAPYFSVDDIRVGRNSQTATVGSVAATLFPPIPADGIQLYNIAGIDRVPLGSSLSIFVTNRTGIEREFSAIIYAIPDYGD